MSTTKPPSFRKTKNGKWAVMAQVGDLETALASGGKIEVTKKNGDKSSFVVGSLGKPFDVDGVSMCYGYSPEDSDPDSSVSSTGASSASSSPTGSPPSDRFSQPTSESSRPSQAPSAPTRSSDEPIPEYQGSAEDEWADPEW